MAKTPRSGLLQVRVVDMAAFHRLQRENAGARVTARRLSIPVSSVQKLMAGKHWQQQPEKVVLFNQLRGASIDPQTGIPTSDDLAKWGGLFEGTARSSTRVERDVRHVMEAAGVRPEKAEEVVRRMSAANGGEIEIPDRLDTATFLKMMEDRLYRALLMLDDTVIAAAGPRDLSQMISMLTEKRNLLSGQPTAIVRNDQRQGLDRVMQLLLAEAQRRGVTLQLERATGDRNDAE